MTKKFWLIALIVACTVVFGSCDKSEELSVEQCKLDMNLFNQTYTVNDEGCCVLKGRKPIAAEEIQSKVKGYGCIIRKTKCYRFTKRNVPKRKTKRLRYRCPPEPYSNSVRTDFFSYSNAIILENQQINTSI